MRPQDEGLLETEQVNNQFHSIEHSSYLMYIRGLPGYLTFFRQGSNRAKSSATKEDITTKKAVGNDDLNYIFMERVVASEPKHGGRARDEELRTKSGKRSKTEEDNFRDFEEAGGNKGAIKIKNKAKMRHLN